MGLVIKNGTIVTMNSHNEIIKNGAVVIENDKIVDIGKKEDVQKRKHLSNADNIIDAKGMIILPGLVNTHVHTVQSLFRGVVDDASLLKWLEKFILPLEAALDRQDVYTSALLGYGEMVMSGTTACADLQSVHHVGAAFEAAKKIGIRAKIAKIMMDDGNVPENLLEDTDDSIKESVRLIEKWNGAENGRIQCMLGPRFIQSCSKKLLQEVPRLAEEFNVGIHTHANENKAEVEQDIAKFKKRPLESLYDFGLTTPRTILAHCIWLSDNEFQILAQSKTKVSHNPSSNLKLASGICDVPRLLNNQITVGIGTDGAPCNNNLDLFKEMRLTALLGKIGPCKYYDPTLIPAYTALRMATIDGARALGLEEHIGSLEVGKKADIAIINFEKLHLYPLFNAISHLVYSCQGGDVETVIIDGKVVVKNRTFLTIDKKKLTEKAQVLAQGLLDRANIEINE